jgi:hypothetical protein
MSNKDKFSGYNQPLTKEDHVRLRSIFEALEQDPQAYDFLEPVDYIGKIWYLN